MKEAANSGGLSSRSSEQIYIATLCNNLEGLLRLKTLSELTEGRRQVPVLHRRELKATAK
jgi:hypothetical protein